MQFEVVFLLLFGLCLSAPHDGFPILAPGGIGGIFKGPDSETIIRGPDGSEITSEEKAGAVIRDDSLVEPIVAAEPEIPYPKPVLTEERIILPAPIISSTAAPILASVAPAIAPILASPAPQLLTGETYDFEGLSPPEPYPVAPIAVSAAPIALPPAPIAVSAAPIALPAAPIDVKPIEIVEQDPHIIETEIVEAPDVEPEQSSDLKGPSGRIITKGSASVVSGPASTTITEPRKIIVLPPKIAIGTPVIATATIPLNEAPLVAPLPIVTASSIAPLPAVSYEVSSTPAPPALSYSTTAAPIDLGYSTTAAPLAAGFDSSQISLGLGDLRQSIPVIEYSSSNGVINGPSLSPVSFISSTEAPIISSTISTITTDKYAPAAGPPIPTAYLLPPAAPAELAPTTAGLISSTVEPNIQKISRIEDNIAVDGRVDMGYSFQKPSPYRLPQVLGMALTRFYRKTPMKNKDTVVIDDKMGELTQNEIVSYDTRPSYRPPPDLSQSKYIAPALARTGLDASQVNLAPVPLSEVTGLPAGAYRPGYDRGYLSNRYERHAKRRF